VRMKFGKFLNVPIIQKNLKTTQI